MFDSSETVLPNYDAKTPPNLCNAGKGVSGGRLRLSSNASPTGGLAGSVCHGSLSNRWSMRWQQSPTYPTLSSSYLTEPRTKARAPS